MSIKYINAQGLTVPINQLFTKFHCPSDLVSKYYLDKDEKALLKRFKKLEKDNRRAIYEARLEKIHSRFDANRYSLLFDYELTPRLSQRAEERFENGSFGLDAPVNQIRSRPSKLSNAYCGLLLDETFVSVGHKPVPNENRKIWKAIFRDVRARKEEQAERTRRSRDRKQSAFEKIFAQGLSDEALAEELKKHPVSWGGAHFDKLCVEARHTLGNLSLEELISDVKGVTEQAKETMANFRDTSLKVNKLFSAETCISKLMPWLLFIIQLYRAETKLDYGLLILQFVSNIGLADKILMIVVEWFQSKLESLREWRKGEAKAQFSSEELLEWSTFALSGVCVILSALMFGCLPNTDSLDKFVEKASIGLRNISFADRGVQSLTRLYKFVSENVEKAMSFLFGVNSETFRNRKAIKELPKEVHEWCQECTNVLNDDFKETLAYSEDSRRKVWNLRDRSYKIQADISKLGASSSSLKVLSDFHRKVIEFSEKADKHKHTALRLDPMCITLFGIPNIGKSFILQKIGNCIANKYGWREDGRFYARCATKYWDNYAHQPIVIYDDFGQLDSDAMAEQKDYQDLLRLKTNNPVLLDMAPVDEKGIPFTSKLLLCATNIAYPRPNGVADLSALWRRRDCLIHAVVDPQYMRDGKVRRDLIPAEAYQTYSHLRFAFMDPLVSAGVHNSEEEFNKALPFVEFMQRLESKVRIYYSRAESALEAMKSFGRDEFPTAQFEEELETPVESSNDFTVAELEYLSDMADLLDLPPIPRPTELASFFARKEYESLGDDYHITRYLEYMASADPDQGLCHWLWTYKRAYYYKFESMCKIRAACSWIKEKSCSLLTKCKEWVEAKLSIPEVSNFTKILLGVGAALATGTVLFKLFQYFTTPKSSSEFCSGDQRTAKQQCKTCRAEYVSGDQRTCKAKTILCKAEYVSGDQRTAKNVKAVCRAEGTNDPNAMDIVEHRVAPYMVNIGVTSLPGQTLKGFCFKGTLCLTVKHLLDFHGDFIVSGDHGEFRLKRDSVRQYPFPNKDLVVLDFGVVFPSARDSVECFMSQADQAHISRTEALLITRQGSFVRTMLTEACGIDFLRYYQTVRGEEREIQLRQGWQYRLPTMNGDCGSVLVALNPRLAHKIMGVHVAGRNTNEGFSTSVTAEELKSVISGVSTVVGMPVAQIADLQPAEQCKVVPQGNFTIYGAMPPKQSVFQPQKSDIIPSPIMDMVREHVTEPSVLTTHDPRNVEHRSPLLASIQKYGSVSEAFPHADLMAAKEWMSGKLSSMKETSPRRVLTEDESINGSLYYANWEPLRMETSPGYPYVLTKKHKGKLELFEGEPRDYKIANPLLRTRLDEREANGLKGFRYPSIWIDNLKDERRPLKKIQQVKTRTFTIPPVDYSLLCRKYFLAFTANFIDNRLDLPHAVGIDALGSEWTSLYRRLQAVSDHGFAGDFSSFDGKLMPALIDIAVDCINDWYDDDFSLMRKTLCHEIIHTQQLAMNTLYCTHIGNPSGNPITTILNSMVNMMYMYIVYRQLAMEHDVSAIDKFDSHVRFFVFGDDNIVSVHPHIPWYNLRNVSNAFSKVSIEYGAATKDGHEYDLLDLKELTFLKRGFTPACFDKHKILCPIDLDTVYELTNWQRTGPDNESLFYDNLNNALSEAFYHGKDFYYQLQKSINSALKSVGRKPISRNYLDDKIKWEAKFH